MAEQTEYIIRKVVSLQDPDYFCNRSWTLSFNMNTKSWISFHSYIPNFYMAENNFFYSGLNSCCEEFDFIAGTIIPYTTTTTSTPYPCNLQVIIIPEFPIPEPIPTTTTTTTSTSITTTSTTDIPPTTTTTTTLEQEFTACTTFSPYFNPAPTEDSMFLSCGSLVSDFGTITDYVIEWRMGSSIGTTVFITGEGSDLDIQQQHPLVDAVVLAGDLYPVIRYVYIDGNKYVLNSDGSSLWSPDLLDCLSPITIDAITCDTIFPLAPSNDPNYDYMLSYNNMTDIGYDKSRKLKYVRCPLMEYLAWSFNAYIYADQLKIYYCTAIDDSGILIDNFIIGQRIDAGTYLVTNLYPVDYPINPRYYTNGNSDYNNLFITDLTSFTYVAGDYIRIEIIGNPTTNNTDWLLKLQDLSSADLSSTFYDTDISKITDTPVMNWEALSCAYNVTYNTTDQVLLADLSKTTSSYFLWKYTQLVYVWNYTPVLGFIYDDPLNCGCRWLTNYPNAWVWYGTSIYQCTNLPIGETIILTKTVTDITITLPNDTVFNNYKYCMDSILASPNYAYISGTSDTDIEYYSYWWIRYIVADSCGDATTTNVLSFSYWCPIEWNDIARTMKITFFIPTNNIPDIDTTCDGPHAAVDGNISIMLNTKNNVTYADHSHVTELDPIWGLYLTKITQEDTVTTHYSYFYIDEIMINNLFDLTTQGFCFDPAQKVYTLYRDWAKLTLTEPSTDETRLTNWKLERKVFLRTDECSDYIADTWETVYEEISTTTTTTTTP